MSGEVADTLFWCGSYTAPHGDGAGVGRVRLRSGHVEWLGGQAAVASPSFIAQHPTRDVIYVVAEHRGELVALHGATLRPLGEPRVAGAAACHVRVSAGGDHVVVTCWGDGRVIVYPLDAEGRPGVGVVGEIADDPYATSRATRAHSSAAIAPGHFITTDLGFDLIRSWSYDGGTLRAGAQLPVGEGSGPRHIASAGELHYVVTEFSNEVIVVRATADGRLEQLARCPVLRSGSRPDDRCAEIALDGSGRWLTVSVRGSNRIALLEVATDGAVTPVDDVDCGGIRPRHHVVSGEWVLVANQESGSITTLRLDTDGFSSVVATAAVGSPTCLVPMR